MNRPLKTQLPIPFLSLLLLCLLFSCPDDMANVEVKINNATQIGTIGSIDIPSPGFFWMLQPWKDGTLATIDGKARFAEISFAGKGMRINPLVEFPKQRIDRRFIAVPESDICVTQSGGIFHVADTAAKKTKTFDPFRRWSWRWSDGSPRILDPENGIICFSYYLTSDARRREPDYMYFYNIIYDAKNDTVLYECPEKGESVSMDFAFTPELIWCQYWVNKEDEVEEILYNWKTHEIIRNDLTETITRFNLSSSLKPNLNINVKERYMFASMRKITWDENFGDIKIIPLDYLFPPEKETEDFYLSSDGKWASAFVSGYRGYYGEFLYKKAFFHLDERYPNGISMPVFAEDYYERNWGGGSSFVEHPVYGMCHAVEHHDQSDGKDKLYLRLYKMDGVLEEINRQMLEN